MLQSGGVATDERCELWARFAFVAIPTNTNTATTTVTRMTTTFEKPSCFLRRQLPRDRPLLFSLIFASIGATHFYGLRFPAAGLISERSCPCVTICLVIAFQ